MAPLLQVPQVLMAPVVLSLAPLVLMALPALSLALPQAPLVLMALPALSLALRQAPLVLMAPLALLSAPPQVPPALMAPLPLARLSAPCTLDVRRLEPPQSRLAPPPVPHLSQHVRAAALRRAAPHVLIRSGSVRSTLANAEI